MKKLLLLPLAVALVAGPYAQAQHGGWDSHHSGPPTCYPYSPHYLPHGHTVHDLPLGYARLFMSGMEYYYWEGLYYRPSAAGYVVVPAPVGAMVTALPPGYQTVVVDGTLYYLINGVTYMQTVNGYQVVPMPNVVAQQIITSPAQITTAPAPTQTAVSNVPVPSSPPPVVTAAPTPVTTTENTPAAANTDTFTVNIPNAKGTYTPVTLKRSGNGFIGPQGEFYTDFPRVEQLKAMYGK